MSDGQRPLVGITLGDPAGVGPEIILKALREADLYESRAAAGRSAIGWRWSEAARGARQPADASTW